MFTDILMIEGPIIYSHIGILPKTKLYLLMGLLHHHFSFYVIYQGCQTFWVNCQIFLINVLKMFHVPKGNYIF